MMAIMDIYNEIFCILYVIIMELVFIFGVNVGYKYFIICGVLLSNFCITLTIIKSRAISCVSDYILAVSIIIIIYETVVTIFDGIFELMNDISSYIRICYMICITILINNNKYINFTQFKNENKNNNNRILTELIVPTYKAQPRPSVRERNRRTMSGVNRRHEPARRSLGDGSSIQGVRYRKSGACPAATLRRQLGANECRSWSLTTR
jgi:hypothetical protein